MSSKQLYLQLYIKIYIGTIFSVVELMIIDTDIGDLTTTCVP